MCGKYWRAWEKFLPKQQADNRPPHVKALNHSMEYWHAWEKYLPSQTADNRPTLLEMASSKELPSSGLA
jgi:hypothetical protein